MKYSYTSSILLFGQSANTHDIVTLFLESLITRSKSTCPMFLYALSFQAIEKWAYNFLIHFLNWFSFRIS